MHCGKVPEMGQSRVAGLRPISGDCSVQWNATTAGNWQKCEIHALYFTQRWASHWLELEFGGTVQGIATGSSRLGRFQGFRYLMFLAHIEPTPVSTIFSDDFEL